MENQSEHKMEVKATYPTGVQEWYCKICGRRFILQWPPHYKRIILVEGDTQAIHSGGTGGLTIGSMEIPSDIEFDNPNANSDFDSDDDPYLSPFDKWMKDNNL